MTSRRNLLYDEDDWPDSGIPQVEPRVYPADPNTAELLQGLPQSRLPQSQPPPSAALRTEPYPLSEAWRNPETRRREDWQAPRSRLQQQQIPHQPIPQPKVRARPVASKANFARLWPVAFFAAGLAVGLAVLLVRLGSSKDSPAAAITANPLQPSAIPAPPATPVAVATVATPAPAVPATAQPAQPTAQVTTESSAPKPALKPPAAPKRAARPIAKSTDMESSIEPGPKPNRPKALPKPGVRDIEPSVDP